MKYISLLKGINVGGHKVIKMSDLQSLYQSLSYKNVITYIQSGNVIFETDIENTETITNDIESKIKEKYGFEVLVILITPENLQKIIDENPFEEENESIVRKCYIGFSKKIIPFENHQNIDANIYIPDEFIIKEDCIYIFYPNGAGKTKLNNDILEKKLKIINTIRNLNTLQKILLLCVPKNNRK